MEQMTDQTIKKVLNILDVKYGRTRTKKLEECIKDWLKFKEDQFEGDDKLILVMKKINQRRKELKMSQYE